MRLNILFIVIDSLRAKSLGPIDFRPTTPFLDTLGHRALDFRRAYASECWTLPSHMSMFTGLLPSEHGAHFQTMAYERRHPTIAEILSSRGYYTQIVTRNHIFDGAIPGVTRGFQVNTRPFSGFGAFHPLGLFLAATTPRSRRLMRETGFFHPLHRENRAFLQSYSRALMPADQLVLDHTLQRVAELRQKRTTHFLFLNLYDVHWPYPMSDDNVLSSWGSIDGWLNNAAFPFLLPRIGSHAYLRDGFQLSRWSRDMLLRRYHRAIELADERLGHFWNKLERSGALEDTMVILTSDHGEAFGEHSLFMHDASVWNVHLHVALWIYHPNVPAARIDDVVWPEPKKSWFTTPRSSRSRAARSRWIWKTRTTSTFGLPRKAPCAA